MYNNSIVIYKGMIRLDGIFSRTELLLGDKAMKKLKASRVAIFGIGGVGGYTFEALVRSGIGTLDIIDKDTVSLSNINRQIIALHSTVGMPKVRAAEIRALDISPKVRINTYELFYNSETASLFDFKDYDYIVDAVDTVSAKIDLVIRADENGVPIISSMGAGNKLDPTMFEVSDIYKTSVCPLARVMRRELKNRGIKKLKVVYSKEQPTAPVVTEKDPVTKKTTPGSVSFVPSVVGLIIASEVVKDLISTE